MMGHIFVIRLDAVRNAGDNQVSGDALTIRLTANYTCTCNQILTPHVSVLSGLIHSED